MNTTTLPQSPSFSPHLAPTLHFARALLVGHLRDRKTFLISILTPVFMLTLFWLLAGTPKEGEFDLIGFMFPAIVGFGVMFIGGSQATRLLTWREQGVFQRLAATPVPLGNLVIGAALAQTITGAVQGALIMLFGIAVIRIPVDGIGALLAILIMVLGGACFIALGSLIATFAPKADIANQIYTFTILPMFFFGGGFPPDILPAFIQQLSPWLPTTMFTELIRPLLADGALPQGSWVNFAGLVGLTVVFATLAARRFRWEKLES
ncbi:MAG: hypothetical protein Fur0022_25430 [Anaerolineales bacterium]